MYDVFISFLLSISNKLKKKCNIVAGANAATRYKVLIQNNAELWFSTTLPTKGSNVQIQNTILINANLMLIFESVVINAIMTEKKQSMDASKDEKE